MKAPACHLLGMLLGIVLASCNHKELCFVHNEHKSGWELVLHADYTLRWHNVHDPDYDWTAQWKPEFGVDLEELTPKTPEGLRVLEYYNTDKHQIHNLPPTGGTVNMNRTAKAILCYNNDTEYIVFSDLNSPVEAHVATRSRSRNTYPNTTFSMAGRSEETVNQPDMLFSGYLHEVQKDEYNPTQELKVQMEPVVFTYLIRYEFSKGLQYVAQARGALAGMAAGCYLHNGSTTTNAVTVLYDCTVESFGAQSIVRTFGVPGYPNDRQEEKGHTYLLDLEVRLTNGNTKRFTIDITDQLADQPHGGVLIATGLEVTDEEGKASGGFDVGVEEWGEDVVVPLPL